MQRLVAVFVLLVVCIQAVICVPTGSAHEGRYHLESPTAIQSTGSWIKGEPCPDEQKLTLYIALKHNNIDKLENIFWAVSDPASPTYGQFLTLDQIGEIVTPSEIAISTVRNWIQSASNVNNSTSQQQLSLEISPNKEWIKLINTDIATAKRLLGGVVFHYYEHDRSMEGKEPLRLVRSQEPYSVPADIAKYVDFIGGVNRFPRVKKLSAVSNTRRRQQDPSVTPTLLRSVLNISSVVGQNPNNLQAVAQFLGQYFAPTDLTMFEQQFKLPTKQPVKVLGPNDPNNVGVEASLDIQYIMGVAVNVPTWFVSTGGEHEGQEPFLEWITLMISTSNSPYVHSVSYGDVESSIDATYMQRVNEEFMKIGTMGRSIIFASGDDGVGCNSACTQFAPNWPGSSPYVTAVGGSLLDQSYPLQIVSDVIGSGGFSNVFPMPSYQTTAVANYLKSSGLPPSSYYNPKGRAVPDVSAFSENVEIVASGGWTYVGGTSCAAPVFSAVISLVNDYRFSQSKGPLGFLNPLIYSLAPSNPSMFYDVSNGPTNADACCPGFPPKDGWDAVTGWGVPNYNGLVAALKTLDK